MGPQSLTQKASVKCMLSFEKLSFGLNWKLRGGLHAGSHGPTSMKSTWAKLCGGCSAGWIPHTYQPLVTMQTHSKTRAAYGPPLENSSGSSFKFPHTSNMLQSRGFLIAHLKPFCPKVAFPSFHNTLATWGQRDREIGICLICSNPSKKPSTTYGPIKSSGVALKHQCKAWPSNKSQVWVTKNP